ncbi:MAG: S41 family peptidase, partial [Planctomycetota bacterium]
MSPRTLTWLVLFATLAAGCLRLRFAGHDADDLALEQASYESVRDLIRERYVRDLNPDEHRKIFYGALKGMTSSLDAHSQFLPPELYESLSTSTKGRFAGIGIEINIEARGLTVLTPLLDSPAWKAGIYPGDRIIKIDGQPSASMPFDECELLIKGPPDSPITLTIERDGVEGPITFSMRRAVIQLKSLQAAELLAPPYIVAGGPRIGFIQINQFQKDTAIDLDAALKRLEALGMQALILDLRHNPGGLLDEAGQVGDLFLKDGPIVTLLYRDIKNQKRLESTREVQSGKTHPNYPLAILIDSQSASAAEIVAGALRDRGRAVLVGDKSYGKFSVQDVIPIPVGKISGSRDPSKTNQLGALKLTIAKYKTPKSDCIDGQGLVPEVLVPGSHAQQKELLESRYRRHLRD